MAAKVARVKLKMQFRSVIADCNALWEVKEYLGKGGWLCEVVNEPMVIGGKTYPGEYAGRQQAFLDNHILGSVNMAAMFEGIHDENEKFLQSQKVGTVLHYHNSFGSYIRQVVVNDSGRNKLKPVALVGLWDKHDLPYYYPNGEKALSFHAKKVLEGELSDRMQVSTTYEHPKFVGPRGVDQKTGQDRAKIDPRKLNPHPLELAPLTGDKLEAARLWKLIESIQEVLHPKVHDKLDQYVSTTPLSRLKAAEKLLQEEFAK